MADMPHSDVVVLGAGIVGVCCALSVIERGHSVTLIDRKLPGQATSFGNAGVISPWSCVPQCLPGIWKKVPGWLVDKDGPVSFDWNELPATLPWIMRFFSNATLPRVNMIADSMDALMAGNIDLYRHHLAGTGKQNLLLDSWYINVFRGDNRPDLNDLSWRLRLDRGAPIEIVGRNDLLDLEPALSSDCHSAVIIKQQARAAHPGLLTKALADKALSLGGNFLQTDIKALSIDNNNLVMLHSVDQTYSCNKLVLAGGIWSIDLLRPLGYRLPLIGERGYHVHFSNPGFALNHSVMDVAGKFVVSSMTDGIRAAGTTEFAKRDAPPNHQRTDALQRQVCSLLPKLNAQFRPKLQTEPPQTWMGIRPSFPDNLPAVGPLPNHHNIIAAFGHSHYGMGMAPATGRLVAGMISGETVNQMPKGIGPERFM